MVRGTFVLFTDTGALFSTEFNGGMNPDGSSHPGTHALRLLPFLSEKKFDKQIHKFNKAHHNYDDNPMTWLNDYVISYDKSYGRNPFACTVRESLLDFTVDYTHKYFSDYVYLKNVSSEEKEIKIESGTITLLSDQWVVINFGDEISAKHKDVELAPHKEEDPSGRWSLVLGEHRIADLQDYQLEHIAKLITEGCFQGAY